MTDPTVSRRWVRVGTSDATDAHSAGANAAAGALEGATAELVVVFCSGRYDLAALLAGVRSVSGAAEVIGCSTAGEIASTGPNDASVAVLALGGEGFAVSTASAQATPETLREAGAAAAACIEEVAGWPHRVLLLLTDGLGGDQQEVVRGAYSVAGPAVPLVGGCAGDDLAMKQTFQVHGDQVLTQAIVAAAIGSAAPIGIGVRHGWRRVGEPMLVTRSAANRVYALDDRPALEAYLDRLGAPAEARTDPGAFTRFALTHPFGISRRSGEEVRFIADADFDEGSIGCIAEVPQGGLAWIMEGDDDSVLAATDAACAEALDQLDGRAPIGLLAFDCIARRGVLGEEGITREVDRIGAIGGGAPVAGFYTYGEIARTRGLTGFHNQTLVVLALS